MSDEDDSCKLRVSGVPNSLTSEEIELFFESERYCPNGGDVKGISYLSPDVVVVTFCDSGVIGRLGGCVTMPGDIKLYLEPYKLSKSQGVGLDGSGVKSEHRDCESSVRGRSPILVNEGIEDSEHQVKTSSSTNANLSRSTSKSSLKSNSSHLSERNDSSFKSAYDSFDLTDILNISTGSSSSSSSQSQIGVNVGVASESVSWKKSTTDRCDGPLSNHTSNSAFGNKVNYKRTIEFADKRSNSFSVTRGNTKFGDKYSTYSGKMGRSNSTAGNQGLVMEEDSDIFVHEPGNSGFDVGPKEDLMNCPADTLFPSSAEDDCFAPRVSNSADVKTTKLAFSVEKFKLLKLAFQSKRRIIFDEESRTVTVAADDLMRLHETALQCTNNRLDIPKSSQKLLLSKRGDEWLAREFSQRHLSAVLYVSAGQTHITALDDTTLQSAFDLLDKILTSQKLPFDDSVTSYLQSTKWAAKVQEFESSGLVSIDTDYSQKFVLITGSAADVRSCALEVQKMLNMNSNITRSMKQKIGVVRLLTTQSHEMMAKVNASTGSSVQLEFDVPQGLIKVTGTLDEVEKAVQAIDTNYIKVVCYDKYEVNIHGLTIEMFKSKSSLGSEMIDLLELRNKCVIEVRGTATRAAAPQRVDSVAAKPPKRKSHRFQLQQGSIVEFKADVLVNSIAHQNLDRAGIINNCFLKAGGSRLVQELRQSVPQDFGHDVLMTSGGRLDTKFVFHAAIRRYRNQESLDRLYKLIRKCLKMAEDQHDVNSIAFPTLGCGKLGYDPKEVAECFSRAVKKTGTTLQIAIISFEDHLLQDFKSAFSRDSTAGSSDADPKDDSWFSRNMRGFFSRPRHTPVVNHKIVFHINAMNDDVIRDVRENLAKRINEMVTEAPIKDEAIAELSDETVSRIEAFATSGVDIKIDRKKSTITVKGVKSLVDEVKMKVFQQIYKEGSAQERHRGGDLQSSIRYPKHWSFYKSARQPSGRMDHKRTELLPTGKGIFEEVSQLVMQTWEKQKVGIGNDAAGLGPHAIKIRRIYCIENPSMYRTYMSRKEEFRLGASVNKYPRINGLQGEREIMTRKLGLKHLDASLTSEVNECYLLHGTKGDVVDSIESTGLDSRLSQPTVLFGPGTYFTESSTKADQYADAKNGRRQNGQPLYIYVCRVLLGHAFVCQTPKPFKRAPCMQAGCHSDVCGNSHPYVGAFDSVIGTHKGPPNVRLLFREFVIYHPDQSYPEFLVEYERQ